MSRTIQRRMARALYDEFSRKWQRERRAAGKAGKPGFRKPTFNQWHTMHLRDMEMMRASTPVDVQEFLGRDPWAEESPGEQVQERRVGTVPSTGDETER